MLDRFFPDIYIENILDLPIQSLSEKGIQGLIFDIDNTLAPFNMPYAENRIITWLEELKQKGFKVCLLSNNSKKRVTVFNEKLNVEAVYWANKPFKAGIKKAMACIGTNQGNTAIIGDQIFTDIWCGSRAGVFKILVAPLAQKDQFLTKIKRGLEKKVLNIFMEKHRDRVVKGDTTR